LFLLGLLEWPEFRRRCRQAARAALRGLRVAFIDLPRQALPLAWVRRLVTSWGFQLVYWYLVKPLGVCALLVLLFPELFATLPVCLGAFLVASFALNSRIGHASGEAVTDGLTRLTVLVRAGLLVALVRAVVQVFKFTLDMVEYLLFSVDEWLRFRGGDSRRSLVLRTLLSLLWFPISYVGRFYMVVLIEPGLNPLKFPISSLAAKIVYPYTLANVELRVYLAGLLGHLVGGYLAWAFIWFTLFWLPDVFGFLVWEMKENWSLYRANRGKALRPVNVGPHGETVRGLLQPGFHSGTVPKLYAHLRRAERQAYQTRDWHNARYYAEQLEEVERAIRRFVAREMVALIKHSASWRDQPLDVGSVHLTTNRIRFELAHGAFPARPVEVELKLREGWLVAGLSCRGWLDRLDGDQLRAVTAALAALYKLAGIDLVLEQVRANLPPSVGSFEITARGLVLHPSGGGPALALGPWDRPSRRPAPNGEPALEGVVPQRLLFAQTPLSWEQLVHAWQKDQDGQGHPPLPDIGLELVGMGAAGLVSLEVGGGS
jgi:hypothetical protein